ncbi:MAG TPA: 4Fe-4S dicluster domain-containing protein [Acidimicrobiales bacterium]|nr:4Fe-4S dicluster domain-containing protein [Acidimicrobiales bacterium]
MAGNEDAACVIDRPALDHLIEALRAEGYLTVGPRVLDGAIVPGPVSSTAELPEGWHDEQSPGHYRLHHGDDRALFSWAVGPQSAKQWLLPAEEVVWRATLHEDGWSSADTPEGDQPVALVGLRPCEQAAIGVLDRVLDRTKVPDPSYRRRRQAMVLVVVECGTPADTCFCPSMGTGPEAGPGADLVLTELPGEDATRFVARAGTERGADMLAKLGATTATPADRRAAGAVVDRARRSIHRHIDTHDLPAVLRANLEHPRWQEVAGRCLACGNCTMVCPTCFCTDVSDTTDLRGVLTRTRRWASCFDLEHSFLHGGSVRTSTTSRYRQWLTHKLGTWHDQFGVSGCVGCGRCITWCPVGIDLTEEAAALRFGGTGRQAAS